MSAAVSRVSSNEEKGATKMSVEGYQVHTLSPKESEMVQKWTTENPNKWLHVKAKWGRHVFCHSDATKNFEILVQKNGQIRVLVADKKDCVKLQSQLKNNTEVWEHVNNTFQKTTLMKCVRKHPRSNIVVT
eukprot:jgi/Bigna1/129907/aug1.10_g4615